MKRMRRVDKSYEPTQHPGKNPIKSIEKLLRDKISSLESEIAKMKAEVKQADVTVESMHREYADRLLATDSERDRLRAELEESNLAKEAMKATFAAQDFIASTLYPSLGAEVERLRLELEAAEKVCTELRRFREDWYVTPKPAMDALADFDRLKGERRE